MLIVTPSDFSAAPPAGPAALFDWATSANGQQVLDHGQGPASLLPRDDDVVLVLPPRAVSWHRVALPKVATARLRAALDGLLEDRVLTDTADLHFALEPGGRSGQTVWVAACHRTWLRGWLQTLESAGRPVSRIVPALWPLVEYEAVGAAPGASRSFALEVPSTIHWAHHEGEQAWLGSASLLGVSCMPLREPASGMAGGATASAVVTALMPPGSDLPGDPGDFDVWLADPGVAELAERVLQQRFERSLPAPSMTAATASWSRSSSRASNARSSACCSSACAARCGSWRSAPAWRPARWGLAALVGAQLLGLNAAAWHERSLLSAKQEAVQQTLQTSFPQVTLVLDAPVQMQRELARLQQASGALTPGDLEALLTAIDQAANGESMVPSSIEYTQGEGRFKGWRASEDQVRALQQSLERNGWRVRFDGSEITLRPPEP
ncbi:type II secretion system protein GspL [Hydrogenophaga sp.]|uniref:type II secretion system protein GspL n=1 Tax=Hydrogenophaga sp. TaxID=1904254 RepID=UPI003D2CE93D